MQKPYTTFNAPDIYLKIVIPVSLLLLGLSFTQNSYYLEGIPENEHPSTVFLFFLGWIGFLGDYLTGTILWMANPLYILSILLCCTGKRITAFILSLIASILAFSFSLFDGAMVSKTETYAKIISLETGYWLWLGSIALLMVGIGLSIIIQPSIQKNKIG